ncbi:MAG TPA: choice-of-anchor L domain-containing protein [Nannocystaceae bacterium]|nr:choice-of-anchor L domain-containing protein [Nannocystaceae bacterium]
MIALGLTGCVAGSGRDGASASASGGIDPSAGDDDGGTADDGDGSGGAHDDGDAGTGAHDDHDGGDDGAKFDLGSPDGGGVDPGCETDRCECTIPDHVPCDAGTDDPFRAIGLNCPGELQVDASAMGPALGIGVRSGFGPTPTFDPREGSVYAVIGSGRVTELDTETPNGDSDAFPTHCNDDLGNNDPGATLPAPIVPTDVGGDCAATPNLVGTGDCSNTIQAQFDQGGEANDYVELRFELDVPPDVISFSYDFAFFSVEYPEYYGSEFNDMYIGWLESEAWTGNISFDADGNPISLNAGFLEFKDDAASTPELDGTCMKRHAGTNWLTTTAGVTPGEHITVVFAIFDLSDSILDSYAFVDDFQWGCDPTGQPQTEPEG